MRADVIRKYVGYTGQVGIVLISIYLLYTVGMDFDLWYIGASDDARWFIPKEKGSDYYNTIGLLCWGGYLLVTGTHLFLYFVRLSSMKKFNMWALPTFNIDGVEILSAILSSFFIFFVFIFHTIMPDIYTPRVVSYDPYDIEYDSFSAHWITDIWMQFTFITSLHLFLYIITRKSSKQLLRQLFAWWRHR